MKKITAENYYKSDGITEYFRTFDLSTGEHRTPTESDYIMWASDINLNENVAANIHEIFEASKALFMYGYLYWTFFTLALEQALKAFEATISHIHLNQYGSNHSFDRKQLQLSDMIARLIKKGVIDKEKKEQYSAIRQMRNLSFHPKSQTQLGYMALDPIRSIANEINYMFDQIEK